MEKNTVRTTQKHATHAMIFAAALAAGAHSQVGVTHLDFEGAPTPGGIPLTQYVSQYTGEGGAGVLSLVPAAGYGGTQGFQERLTQGQLLMQFNPYTSIRGFARQFSKNPSSWQFNTYDRMTFWIKAPTNAAPLATGGRATFELGTYVKRVYNADRYSDETGGGHFYHKFNLPPTGTWTKVIMNMHPSHRRGDNGNTEQGNQPHPTGESGYNYFDALTRFYFNELGQSASSSNNITYQFDNIRFYDEPETENDDQVYSIAATYVPAQRRYILTWSRRKDQGTVKHEVRYSTQNIRSIGWNNATPAPNGIITPPGEGGYNGMVYNTTYIPVTSGPIYFAIKPQNSSNYSQISLGTDGGVTTQATSGTCTCPCATTAP